MTPWFSIALSSLVAFTSLTSAKTIPALLQLQPWRQLNVEGVDYVSLSDLLNFYHFQYQAKQDTIMQFVNKDMALVLGEKSQYILLDSLKIKLLHPLRKDAKGELMLSKEDCVYLLDPILRPPYITPRQQLKRVIIDPCHSDAMQGMRPKERAEKAALSLAYATELESKLKAIGYDVVLTRRADYFMSPTQRMEIANAIPESIFISLRFNDYNPDYEGMQSFIAEPKAGRQSDSKNAALALCLHSHLIRWAGMKDGGLQRVRYNVVNDIDVPAVILNLGNLCKVSERVNLHEPEMQKRTVAALVQGIQVYAMAVSEATAASVAAPEGAPQLAPVYQAGQSSGEIEAVELPEEELQAVEVPAEESEELQAVEVE